MLFKKEVYYNVHQIRLSKQSFEYFSDVKMLNHTVIFKIVQKVKILKKSICFKLLIAKKKKKKKDMQ